MSSMIGRWNGIFFLAVTSALGCKLGVPIDRNVQISRHFADGGSADEPPQTRLVHSGSVAQTSGTDETEQSSHDGPVVESLTDLPPNDAPGSPQSINKSEKPPVLDVVTVRATDDQTAIDAEMLAAAGLENADMAELLAAFRDSPPHIQQQAIRQLIAAASLRATQTGQPSGIDQQLRDALGTLPILPDEVEDSGVAPIRLAATGRSPQPAEPEAVEPEAAAGQAVVSQAVASAEDANTAVTAASSTLPADSLQPADATQTPAAMSSLLDPSAPPANQPTVPARDESTLFAELLETLQTPLPGESDGDRFRRDVIRRHLLVLSGDPDTAVDAMKGLTRPEQEFLRHHLLAVWQMTNPEGHPVASRRLSSALPKIQTANQHLRQASEQLDLRSLAFCTEIVSFGQVKRFQTSRFDGGQKVILYCEVDNFVAEKNSDGYETELQGSYEVFDESGNKVAGLVLPADRQICDHYLRDYFIAYQMNLPTELQPGNYRLELTMECVKGKKFGQASIPLTIK